MRAIMLLVSYTSARKSNSCRDPILMVNAHESAGFTGVLSDERNNGYGFYDFFL